MTGSGRDKVLDWMLSTQLGPMLKQQHLWITHGIKLSFLVKKADSPAGHLNRTMGPVDVEGTEQCV